MYALQWFSFAVIALIIYALALRKRWKKEPTPRER
jgi:cytochrome oxidase assembly protein ShyY1